MPISLTAEVDDDDDEIIPVSLFMEIIHLIVGIYKDWFCGQISILKLSIT